MMNRLDKDKSTNAKHGFSTDLQKKIELINTWLSKISELLTLSSVFPIIDHAA
jgi:hypothetical protein